MDLTFRMPDHFMMPVHGDFDDYDHWDVNDYDGDNYYFNPHPRELLNLQLLGMDDNDTTDASFGPICHYHIYTPAFKNTTHLESMELDPSQIPGADPPPRDYIKAISSIPSLRTLSLVRDSSYDLPQETDSYLENMNPNVRSLVLDHVDFTIPVFRKSLAFVQILILADCFSWAIDESTTSEMVKALASSQIRMLHLNNREMEPPRIHRLILAMVDHPTLRDLQINGLEEFSGRALRDVLDSTTDLRFITIEYSKLHAGNFSFVVQGIITNHTVRSLELSDCKIQDADLLSSLTRSNNTTLRELSISNSSGWSCEALCTLFKSLTRNTSIEVLTLSSCPFLPSEACYGLSRLLARNRSLTSLNLPYSRIDFFQISDMGLCQSSTIKILDLSCCGLDDIAVYALGVLNSVEELNLGYNNITDVSRLRHWPMLQSLDLSSTAIDDNAAAELAGFHNLKALFVSDCCLGVRGIRSLISASLNVLQWYYVELPSSEWSGVTQALTELLPGAAMRFLGISISNLTCSVPAKENLLAALARNHKMIDFDDNETWLSRPSDRQVVQYLRLRNSIQSTSTNLVPMAWEKVLAQKGGVSSVYRMLRDHPLWITKDALKNDEKEGREPAPKRRGTRSQNA